MIPEKTGRVAPLVALLVIILGLIFVFWGMPNLPDLDIFLTPATEAPVVSESTEQAEPTIIPTLVPPTATFVPINSANAYDVHRSRGEMQAALYHIEAQSLQDGWTAQSHIRAGNLWRDMGDVSRALPQWEAAMRLEPNPNLLRQIAEIYIERGEWGVAWERIQQLLQLAPNDSWGQYYGGLIIAPYDPTRAYGLLGQATSIQTYARTAFDVQQAIGSEPTDPEIALRVATILAGANEWSLAENAYQYAADTFYPFAEATAYVALMRVQQGKNGERWIQEALSLSQDNAEVHYIAGVYWRAAGEFAQSESNLMLAILFDSNNPTFYAELGTTYQDMGNRFEAEIWFQTAVLISDDPIFEQALASYYQEETFLLPQDMMQYGRGISANDPAIQSASGWTLHIQGDTEAGLAQVEAALERDSDNPRALFDKARILIDLAEIDEARPILEDLAEGDSVFANAAARLLESLG